MANIVVRASQMGQLSKIVTGEGKKNQHQEISSSFCDSFIGRHKMARTEVISLCD